MPTLPKLPLPLLSEPSPLWILDLIQGHEEAGYRFLKSLGLTEMADFHGNMDRKMATRMMHIRELLPAEYQMAVGSTAMDYQPYSVWLRHREVYEPHPAMSRALVKMSADSTIPGTTFQQLRHPNPLFLLSGAPPIRHADGRPGRVLALLFTGAISNAYPFVGGGRREDDAPRNASIVVDTTDVKANAYQVTVISEVHDHEGTKVIDIDWCHMTLPIRQAFTLDDLVEETALGGFHWDLTLKQGLQEANQKEYLLTAARTAVAHLLYACSRTVEMDDKPRASRPPVRRVPGQPREPKAARMRRLGWRLGTAIEDTVRRQGREAAVSAETGQKKAPHIRSAHLHMYRVGQGRQEIEMKWLDPIAVNAGQDDGRTVTRHKVR